MIDTEELVMIFAVVMLLFGANKIPELVRSMGSSVGEFKKTQKESEMNLKAFEKSVSELTVSKKTKLQETAEKL